MKLLLQIFKTMEKSEFCVFIKHCFLIWKNTVQAKQWLDKYYLDSALSETMVKRRYADFKCTCTDLNDAECLGCPNSAVFPENTKKLHKLVLVDCKLKLREIAMELKAVYSPFWMNICLWESFVQSGSYICSQLIKNNKVSMIQSVVCNCFNATKKSFCVNMWQWLKHGSTTSLGVKSAVSCVDSSRGNPSKVTKDTNINRQGFGLRILQWARYFVHWLLWERKNHQ